MFVYAFNGCYRIDIHTKLDDVLRDARNTLQFHLKSFLYILKLTYNAYFVILYLC